MAAARRLQGHHGGTDEVLRGMPGPAERLELGFGGLLRQLRAEALLTQEELADAAKLSPRSVSDLERGINRTARKDTALLLAGALGLAEPVRGLFAAAALGRGPAEDVLAAREGTRPGAFAAAPTRSLPRDIVSFTGRQAELAQVLGSVAAAAAGGGLTGIWVIGGMAGAGKTAFAVHAAHRLAGSFPDGQFYLPLHAHTRGQRPVEPADALGSLLLTAGLAAQHLPPGEQARAARWRDFVAGKKILLLLDDAAGHEQVRPLLPGAAGSLVLVTSRRRLTALDDSAAISLGALSPGEAAAMLARLAARPGIGAADAAVGEITRLCGYLPLAIGMLARQLSQHPAWTAGDLAASLAAARDRLATMRAENLSVAAAFDLSYADLPPARQRLFRRLGLIPGPSFDACAAAALDDISLDQARRGLEDLYDQHLITEPAPGRYLLHDLLREHARTLAAADDPADSRAAAGRLLDYYLHTAVAAGQHHFAGWATQDRPPPGQPPAHAPALAAAGQAAAWLETERPNLHAAADYAAATGRHQYASAIAAATGDFLCPHGHWDQAAALYLIALTSAGQAGDRPGQARALRELGIMEKLTGDYPAAAASLARAAALYRDLGDQSGQARALNHLGHVHLLTGDYPAATATHEEALALARGSGDQLAEAATLGGLAWVQRLTGEHQAAAANLASALHLYRGLGHRLGEAVVLGDIGSLQRLTGGDYPAAATSLQQTLELCRSGGDRPLEGVTLGELGMVQQLTGDHPAAATSLQQALELCHDLGSRHGQARALNSLGELSSRISESRRARDQHTEALALARDLGVPLEEARALEGIGRSHLQDGDRGQAAAHLRQALAIYQRIGAPCARQVQEALRHHRLHHHDNLHSVDQASEEA